MTKVDPPDHGKVYTSSSSNQHRLNIYIPNDSTSTGPNSKVSNFNTLTSAHPQHTTIRISHIVQNDAPVSCQNFDSVQALLATPELTACLESPMSIDAIFGGPTAEVGSLAPVAPPSQPESPTVHVTATVESNALEVILDSDLEGMPLPELLRLCYRRNRETQSSLKRNHAELMKAWRRDEPRRGVQH
ncbi:hypothetical protein BCR33DRAFT_741224 [Rhizoclosmatium globosum]|uniref:Uncharacterized protein n=1 Tax=Rhizoclosmatium globosum TaxID=329046 RepID=A0A1Y2BYL3_9FUNG|nr:hypothetical protein BCR33DRAFT_741224 [Rhizoclosmatium globosum]|eukprot:ORY39155.1 hypothetical protein BCR33DRAFT_741224 [Rhizoclosmatium globosum]